MNTPEDEDTGTGRLIADRYRLETKLGSGAMGRVWSGVDELLRRPVAIKEVLLPAGMPEEDAAEQRERALREARAIAVLTHPNVVTLYDVARDQGRPFVVMELMPSRSLASIVEEHGALAQPQLAAVADGVAAALEAAHQTGIIHRDIKPSNVLVGESSQVKLSDFGISRNTAEPTITRRGIMLGTPAFVAPEIASGEPVTTAADLWGLGAALFAAAEGRPPYDVDDSPIATVTAVVRDPVPVPSRPGPITEIITGLMVKDPARRMPLHEVRRRAFPLLARGGTRPFDALVDSGAPTVRSPVRAPASEATPSSRWPSPAQPSDFQDSAFSTANSGPAAFGGGAAPGRTDASAPAPGQLASDPGPLPFTPRDPEPARRSPWSLAALGLASAVVFAAATVTGFTTGRTITGDLLGTSESDADAGSQLPPLVPKSESAEHTADRGDARFDVAVPAGWEAFHAERTDITNSTSRYYVAPDGEDLVAVKRFGGYYAKGYSTQRYLQDLPEIAAGWPGGYRGEPPRSVDGGTGDEPDLALHYRTVETGMDNDAGTPKERSTRSRVMRRGNDLWVLRVTVPRKDTARGAELFRQVQPTFRAS